ncbi:MAG: type II toxin-antitoxin system VapC family toxin [Bdellovibrionota bacterium]
MRLLIDTHVALFAAISPGDLTADVVEILKDPTQHILLSQASLWEIALLVSRNRIHLKGGFKKFISGLEEFLRVEILPLQTSHFDKVTELPFHHKDPFDRILVSQALVERVPLISRDEVLDQYDIRRIW